MDQISIQDSARNSECASDHGKWWDILFPSPHHHMVQFYKSDKALAKSVCHYAAAGLSRNHFVILIATKPHSIIFEHWLKIFFPIDNLKEEGKLVTLDAKEMLDLILKKGADERRSFEDV